MEQAFQPYYRYFSLLTKASTMRKNHEKMSILETEEYLAERARRGSEKKFKHVLSKVKDIEPTEEDRFPR